MSSDSHNLVRCLRCAKTLIREEFEGHKCVPTHRGVRHIDVSQYWVTETELGEPLVMALGLDGYIYRLTQVRSKSAFEELQSTGVLNDSAWTRPCSGS
jgi:hypothetical protein